MSRLPAPGGDDGNWGNILNDYLSQVHKTDGSLKDGVITGSKLANSSVDTTNIADGAVTNAKLSSALQTTLANVYSKPASGIPETDLESTVQTKIDGAYIKPGTGVPESDLASGLQTKIDTALQPGTSGSNLADGSITSNKLATGIQTTLSSAYIKPGTGIPESDLASAVQTKVDGALQPGVTVGGDLSGTLPNPTVAQLNGIGVSGTPAAGQVLTATSTSAATWGTLPVATPTGYTSLTVASWESTKGTGYMVAHRGSMAVMPENTLESFDYAYGVGSRIAEVSVNITSDGQLILMHDTTYDRTTNLTGTIAKIPSTVLSYARVNNQSNLGPVYTGSISGYPALKVPLFEDVLKRFGGKMILLCEAKNDACYPQMVALIEKYGLKSSVMIKAYFTNTARITQAKTAGYKVYSYFGSDEDNTAPNRSSMVSLGVDYLAIYAFQTGAATTPVLASQVSAAVNASPTTMKVWAYSIERRVDRDFFFTNGCEGIVADNVGYLSNDLPTAVADTWITKAIAPGELSQRPEVPTGTYLAWAGTNQLTLDNGTGGQSFVCLGQMAPLANRAGTYHINVDFQWTVLPTDTSQNITICFGQPDDKYYQHAQGLTNGYHAIIRASGLVQLYSHVTGSTNGTQLGTTGVSMSSAAVAGTWYHATLDVTPTTITFTVNDGSNHVVTATDSTYRGGYIHLGKVTGTASFRSFAIT